MFYEQPSEAASVLCKPIGAKLWPSTSSWPTNSTSVNTTWHTTCAVCRNYTDFLYLMLILRLVRITRCNQRAALHSALLNYTQLVIGGTDKYKQLTIVKPTETGINRNKWTFYIMKSSEPPKNFKNQPRPLVRPSSINFYQHFWNLSHETVSLRWISCKEFTLIHTRRLSYFDLSCCWALLHGCSHIHRDCCVQ